MNFLLHRHLGARDLGSAAAGLGAMLPDLWRMADRRVRPNAAREGGPHRPLVEPLLLGVEHHLAVDRWFHESPVFALGELEAARQLREARLSARRAVLFAHVLWELCLDGELVRRLGRESIATAIRDGVQQAGASVSDVADVHHFHRVPRARSDRVSFDQKLARICAELVRGPWIESYASAEGIAAIVDATRRRVGLEPMVADDGARLADVARTLLGRAVDAVDGILGTPSFVGDSVALAV